MLTYKDSQYADILGDYAPSTEGTTAELLTIGRKNLPVRLN